MTKSTYASFVTMFALGLLMPLHLRAYSIPTAFTACHSLDVCLRSLDSKASTADGSIDPDDEVIASKLSTFGELAKHELLRRAAGSDPKWRDLSQSILESWKTWAPSDVPELRTALRLEPGGWMARPLMAIGTPTAIDALVEDLPKGSENQTDYAFEKLGARAIPALMPLFEDESTSPSATRAIKLIGDSAAPFQLGWSQIANDQGEPIAKRVGALRAISALGSKARQTAASIQVLSASPEIPLREQATLTLEAIQSFEQKIDSQAQEVSVIQLIANPAKFDGKRVRVIGFLRLEFEGNAIYLHREDYEHAIFENSIWLDRPKDFSEKQATKINKKYVICQGTFSAEQHGHTGMFSGSLTHITRLESWENAVPRD